MKRNSGFVIIVGIILSLIACDQSSEGYQFRLLRKNTTKLDFENVLNQTADFNYFNYMYFFNGGGVVAGDFNKDEKIDLFFTSNMGPNKLFINQGRMKFKDVTEAAQLEGLGGWTSGATIVDINNDGLLDIYVSQLGDYLNIKGRNQLYVCQGIENNVPVFEDLAYQYGLALVGFSTQATFFDYDLDGDLDMFQLNHSLHQNGTFGQKKTFIGTQHPMAGDKLFRNDGAYFTEVTLEAGIKSTVIGYGLGLATGDINLDGWPDIYIGNDFHEDDYLYLNQQDGTFRELSQEQMMHTSRFSMGVDIADVNNDGFNEILSLDMLPDDPVILKSSQGENTLDVYNFKLRYGYGYQYARNNLQLNNGNGTFSEIGLFAGVEATDWSWAPLMLDFDNDGFKDIFITNGIPRRMNDLDYINFKANNEIKHKADVNDLKEDDLEVLNKMPRIKLPNRFFKNLGNLQFEDAQYAIQDNIPSYSNGAVYADLDNDGDLDLVVNNIEEEPFVYQNLTIEQKRNDGAFLKLDLQGPPKNIHAIGARALVFKGEQRIMYEHFLTKGFQSSVAPGLHLGIGDTNLIDSIVVIWPDLSFQKLENIRFNQKMTLNWQKGLPVFSFGKLKSGKHKYDVADITEKTGIDFYHEENDYVDFNRELLIPQMVSSEGPALAIGDVNNDGLEDIFLGASKRKKSKLFLQSKDGQFYEDSPTIFSKDSLYEDVDAVFVDIENDGDLDLVVASGGNEFWGEHEALIQRAYINDGKGHFESRKDIFKGAYLTASCVLPCDFNQDGKTDFFFGGRAVPKDYGKTPASYLFENKGNGNFEDVTAKYAPELSTAGMVKHGAWNDLDQDGDQDLVLAVEWLPIQVFLNNGDHFERKEVGDWKGWWNFVLPHDFDRDGDIDLLAGNTGRNSRFRPSHDEPLRLYVNDFDENGQIEQILTYYLGGKEIPFATFEELTKQMPKLRKRFLYAKDLASASISEIFEEPYLAAAETLEVNTLASVYFENTGEGLNFEKHLLPDQLQFSTLNTALLFDFDQNGDEELILGENFYGTNVGMGRYDAGNGHILAIGEGPTFSVQSIGGMAIKGQVRKIKTININGKVCILLAKNDDQIQVIQPNPGEGPLLE